MAQQKMRIINCGGNVNNTGASSCYFDPKNFTGAIHVPSGTTFTATQMLTMKTALAAAIANDNINKRIFPVKVFEGMEDKSTDAVTENTKYGGMRKVRNGKYAWYYEYVNGGYALHSKLKSFDNKQDAFDVIFIDSVNNGLVGIAKGTNNTEFGGFPLELLDVPNFKLNDGSTSTKYTIGYCMEDTEEVNTNMVILQFEKSWKVLRNITALKDLEINIQTAMSALGLVKLSLTEGGGAIDLADTYSTELATAGLYSAFNYATQLAIAVTSVTYVPATKTFEVLLDNTDPNYPAVVGALITIKIGTVTALVAAGVIGYGNSEITTPRG